LKRFLQRHIETKLARALIAGEVSEGAAITFTVQNDELVSGEETHAAKK
jgi:ATP-dependent Clp protease ATP-binding subunit ClpB